MIFQTTQECWAYRGGSGSNVDREYICPACDGEGLATNIFCDKHRYEWDRVSSRYNKHLEAIADYCNDVRAEMGDCTCAECGGRAVRDYLCKECRA